MKNKSWIEKFKRKDAPEVKVIEKSFWGKPAGSKMLIPTPQIIQNYINRSRQGSLLDVKTMKQDLAFEYGADFTCPLTTGIFLKIVAEANFELMKSETRQEICPFWRIIDPHSDLARKLSFGSEFITKMRADEQ
jgi:hypothetical protein